jgi:hypothetical protein
MQHKLMMDAKLRNFLTTSNLEVAWRCYQDWCKFQEQVGRENEVGFASCTVNGKTCWKVLVTEELHNEQILSRFGKVADRDEQSSDDRHPALAIRAAVILLAVLL